MQTTRERVKEILMQQLERLAAVDTCGNIDAQCVIAHTMCDLSAELAMLEAAGD